MIIESLFKKFKEEDEDLFFGLFGLLAGLLFGLFFGLSFGLSFGLLAGLLTGLSFGLLTRLLNGLLAGLLFGLGFLIIFIPLLGAVSLISHFPNFIPLWFFLLIGIILMELFFWLDIQKPKKKQSKFRFTCLKKGEALLEAVAILGTLNLIRLGIKKIIVWKIPLEIILKWGGYIGVGLICLGIIIGVIYLYIKLNSLKYKK